MKRLSQIFLISLIFSISLILLPSCQPDADNKDDEYQIDPQVKAQIDSLNEQIMLGAYQNNPVLIEEAMSPKLLETSGSATDVLVQQLSSIANSPSFQVFDEYYLQGQTGKPITQTYSGGLGPEAFSIKHKSLTDKIYISILRPDEQYADHLITLIYGLYEDDWKLNIIQFGQYAFLGKTAINLWDDAKAKEAKGYFVDATNSMSLAMQCLKPAKQFWEYREEGAITRYYEGLMKQINAAYQFPIQVEVVESKPVIFGIYPQTTEEGIFPMVEYMSTSPQEDSLALQQENALLHQQIGTIFPGLDQEKTHVLYRAYDSIPNGKRIPVFHGFIQPTATTP